MVKIKRKYIAINGINDIVEFIHQASKVNGEVTCKRGKYVVDGKSTMGVFFLIFAMGVVVEYPEDAHDFEKYINNFEVENIIL